MNTQPETTLSSIMLALAITVFALMGTVPTGAIAETSAVSPTKCGTGGKMTIIFHDNENPELSGVVTWTLSKKGGGVCIPPTRRHQGVYAVEINSAVQYTLSYKIGDYVGTRDITMTTPSANVWVDIGSFKPKAK